MINDRLQAIRRLQPLQKACCGQPEFSQSGWPQTRLTGGRDYEKRAQAFLLGWLSTWLSNNQDGRPTLERPFGI